MTGAPTTANLERLRAAGESLRGGQPDAALSLLQQVVSEQPDLHDAQRLLGLALRDTGDAAGAEAALRRSMAAAPNPILPAVPLASLLSGTGRAPEALEIIEPLLLRAPADVGLLTARGDALKAMDRVDEAADTYRRAIQAAPASAVAEHNLGAVLGDAEEFAGSEAAARRALEKGGQAPETWLILARALRGLGRYAEAETAFLEALRRRPYYVDAHSELSKLIWMRTADAGAASHYLDGAVAANPGAQPMWLSKAEVLEFAGDLPGAYAAISAALRNGPAHPLLHVVAVRLAAQFDPPQALAHAEAALDLAPDDPGAMSALCQANLAVGRADAAAEIALTMHERAPLDQHAIGYLATAWRLLGDPRYRALYDYDSFVRGWRIDAPKGWPDVPAYLADLKASLLAMHTLQTHPVGQSLRHGSQTSQSLTKSDDPAIRAFFGAIDGPIRRHIAWLGSGDDLLRARTTGDYRLNGIWSVKLHPRGFHANHLHHMGWLSSAFYVDLPKAVDQGHEGWLKFGEPGVPTEPVLAAEHYLKPEAGMLALFPSYMWHGTAPFSGDEHRLTIAFDIVPA